jgi:hypothetical protein
MDMLNMIKKVVHIEFTKDFLYKQIAVIPCDRNGEVRKDEVSESMIGMVVAVEPDMLTLQVPVVVPEFHDEVHESSEYEPNYIDQGFQAGDTMLETMYLDIKDVWNMVNREKFPVCNQFLLVKLIELSVGETGLVNKEIRPL